MAKKEMKNMVISVDPKDVLRTSIEVTKNDYNMARVIIKKGDNEYLSINYEWHGNGSKIPDFAMELMNFMKQNNVETSAVWAGKEEEFANYEKRYK